MAARRTAERDNNKREFRALRERIRVAKRKRTCGCGSCEAAVDGGAFLQEDKQRSGLKTIPNESDDSKKTPQEFWGERGTVRHYLETTTGGELINWGCEIIRRHEGLSFCLNTDRRNVQRKNNNREESMIFKQEGHFA